MNLYAQIEKNIIDVYQFQERIIFLEELIVNEEYPLAKTELSLLLQQTTNPYQIDSLNVYLAYIYCKQDNLPLCLKTLDKAATFKQSTMVKLGTMYTNYLNKSFKPDYESNTQDALLSDVSYLLQAATLLDTREIPKFNQLVNSANIQDFEIKLALTRLQQGSERYLAEKVKSPILAATCALVPGGGKLYLGRWADAVTSFTLTAGFAIQAWEGARRNSDLQFYTFGAITALWYVSGIYNSALQAHKHNLKIETDFSQYVDVQVRVPIHTLLKRPSTRF